MLYKLYTRFYQLLKFQHLRTKCEIGTNVNVTHKFILDVKGNEFGIKIGNNVWLDGKITVLEKGKVVIGNDCSFRRDTYIGALESITIGDNVFGAENVYICDNNNHPTSPLDRLEMTSHAPNTAAWKWTNPKVQSSPIIIGNNVWIGRNATLLKGVKVGQGSIIAANSVLTKTYPPYCVIAGNPAKVVKTLNNL